MARVVLAVCGVLAYPLLVHLGVVMQQPALLAAGLCSMLLTTFAPAWVGRGWLRVVVAFALAGLLIGLASWLPVTRIAQVPPVLFAGSLALIFGASLRRGSTPLTVQVAEKIHQRMRGTPLPEDVRGYARGVTVYWVFVFVLIAGSSLIAAVYASPEVWSILTNAVNYVVVALAMVVEFAVRKARFGDRLPYRNFLDYMRQMRAVGWRPEPAPTEAATSTAAARQGS